MAPTIRVERPRQVTDKEPVAISGEKTIYKQTTKTVIDSAPGMIDVQSRIKADLELTHRQKDC